MMVRLLKWTVICWLTATNECFFFVLIDDEDEDERAEFDEDDDDEQYDIGDLI